VVRFIRWIVRGRRDLEQLAGACEAGLAGVAGEQAVVPDAMEAAWQDMEQEAADELIGREHHDLLTIGPVAAIVFVAEGDAAFVETDEATIRDRHPVGVARQICEHGLRPGEGRLGIDHPALLPDGSKVALECPAVGKVRHRPEEGELSGIVQRDQPGEE